MTNNYPLFFAYAKNLRGLGISPNKLTHLLREWLAKPILAKPLNDLMNFALSYKVKFIKSLSFIESVVGIMSEQNKFVASDETVGRNRKPNRKAPKQISFRVSESEYLKLKQSAETLNMSVPNFVKKKAQGSRLVAPKLDKTTRQSIAKDLGKLGSNANQIAKYCNQHQYDAPNYEALEHNISELRERLDEIWQQLK